MTKRLSARVAACLFATALSISATGASSRPEQVRDTPAAVPPITPEQLRNTSLAIDVLAELNAVRTDPQAYSVRMQGLRIRGIGRSADFNDAVTFLDGQRPLPPLIFSPALSDIAAIHARDIGTAGLMSHTGTDGSTIGARMRRRGVVAMLSAEELSFGQSTGPGVVIQLIVDAGLPNRPHRQDLFNPVFTMAGVGCAPHERLGRVCVINLTGSWVASPPAPVITPADKPNACPPGRSPMDVDRYRSDLWNAIGDRTPAPDLVNTEMSAAELWAQALWAPRPSPAAAATTPATRPPSQPYVPTDFCGLPEFSLTGDPPRPGAGATTTMAVPTTPAGPATTSPPLGLEYSFGPGLPDFLGAGIAYRPGLILETEPDYDSDALRAFEDFSAEDLTCDAPPEIAETEPPPLPPDVADLYAGYSFSSAYGYTSIQAGINNLSDTQPPRVFGGFLANSDAENYDYIGRYFYIGLRHCL